jgi:hypothetical protein
MLATAPAAANFNLPPIDGEFAGDLALTAWAGAPKLRWTLHVHKNDRGDRAAEIAIDGAGTRVRGDVALAPDGSGSWRLREGVFELGEWAEALRARIGPRADGVAASGTITAKGVGALKNGSLTGGVSLALEDGKIAHAGQGWTLERVTLRGDFSVGTAMARWRSEQPFEFGIGSISTSRFGARNLFATGWLQDGFKVALTEARVEIAGGRVEIDPCVVTLLPPAVDVNVRIEEVGLQDVAALVPAGLADAHGRIDGAVRMGWSEAQGFQLGAGALTLARSEPALVRLAPAPGCLTDRVPQHFNLLPSWLGPLARWFRPENPAYAEMRRIELGETELHVTDLAVKLTPAGDGAGRTALVTLTAKPAQSGGTVEAVTFAINVSGPLSEVLRLGFNQSFSIETR